MIHHALGQTAAKPWGIRGNVGNCRRNPALKPRLIWKNKITFMEVRYIYIYIYFVHIKSINQSVYLSQVVRVFWLAFLLPSPTQKCNHMRPRQIENHVCQVLG